MASNVLAKLKLIPLLLLPALMLLVACGGTTEPTPHTITLGLWHTPGGL